MRKWETIYLDTMKLVTNASTVRKLLKELLLEYKLQEENPFAAAGKDEKGGDDEEPAADEGEGVDEGGDEEGDEKEKKKPTTSEKALTIKFDPTAVKRYNTNKDWRAGEAEVKKISKKGIEVDIDGTSVLVNFDDITERAHQFFKTRLQEQATELDAEDKKQVSDLEREMGAVANELGSAFSAASDEIKQQVEEIPEDELKEHKQKLNEAISVTVIIGFILALPKLVEIITKAVSKIVKLIQKLTKANPPETEQEKVEWAEKIIEFTHKWHKLYIKAFYYMFKMSGLYKKAGITDESTRMKVAKIFYYTVVAGLAVAAGIGAVGAFKTAASQAAHGGEFALGTFESVMVAIKSGEVAQFLGKLGLSASTAS